MPMPDWTKSYVPGVKSKADAPPFENIPAMLRGIASQYSPKPAFSICLPNGACL